MPKNVRTARGNIIDFDLIKIKEQIASTPKPTDVKAREDFIDKKLRRRVKRIKKAEVVATEVVDEEVAVEEEVGTTPEKTDEATDANTNS